LPYISVGNRHAIVGSARGFRIERTLVVSESRTMESMMQETIERSLEQPVFTYRTARLYHEDSLEWLAAQPPSSLHAIVTDPPYGLIEFTEKEQAKLRAGRGGVWRIPPKLNGIERRPLPRFTVLSPNELNDLYAFFFRFGRVAMHALVPGAHVIIATNPLLSPLLYRALPDAGFEMRGEIIRLVMTLRGGDRPKNAHDEFTDVTVMPRSMFEPWGLFRKPLDGRVQDNLRKWGTGGLRRISDDRPFADVIKAGRTPQNERRIANHPSLKPQQLMRQLVRASLPLGTGTVCDPFAGSGSTLAAAVAVGYESVGCEIDPHYVQVAVNAIAKLARLNVKLYDDDEPPLPPPNEWQLRLPE
jgi:site-specific DNA-methyltransferase (adenine-specific)